MKAKPLWDILEPRADHGGGSSPDPRLLALCDAAADLATSLDADAVLARMARIAVPELGDLCTVDCVLNCADDGAHGSAAAMGDASVSGASSVGVPLRPAAAAGSNPARQAILREIESLYPHFFRHHGVPGVPAPEAPEILPDVTGEVLARLAWDERHLHLLRRLDLRSIMMIPVRAREAPCAVWTFGVVGSGRPYSSRDLALAGRLAAIAAAALSNALSYREARAGREAAVRAADYIARLQAVTAKLSGALTPVEVARLILEGGVGALGACAGAIGLMTEDGRAIEIMQSSGYTSGPLKRSAVLPLTAHLPIAEAARLGEAVWIESVADRDARYPSLEKNACSCEGGAWVGLPLVVNGRVIGGLDLRFEGPRSFSDEERDFTITLARQCTIALERACLFDAERLARKQIAFLADANVLLSTPSPSEEPLALLPRFVVPFLADMCAVDVIEKDGSIRRLGSASPRSSPPREVTTPLPRPPPDRAMSPAFLRVIETGKPQILGDRVEAPDSAQDGAQTSAQDEAQTSAQNGTLDGAAIAAELWDTDGEPSDPKLAARSVMLVPLVFERRTLGVLSLGLIRRRFDERELAIAESLARRAAVAVDRARLFREAEEARQAAERATIRISQLQAITAAASEALTPKQVAEAVVRHAIEPVGACAGGFGRLTEDGTAIELTGLMGYSKSEVDPARLIPLGARSPIPEAVRERTSIFLETAEAVIDRYPKLAPLHIARAYGAMAVIPLLIEGRALGALGLVFPGARVFSDDDRTFMDALGRRCAEALERARAYEAELRAHAAADEANRLKDEFLATLSHELRTPLTAILGWARMLRTTKVAEGVATRALATIERNATLQSRLIDDLLDASRIITGKLRLEVHAVDLGMVIQAAIDAVSHAATAKSIRLVPILDPEVGSIDGDGSRLQQIVWNLLSNAIKFTPPGGVVEVCLDRDDNAARIRVTDSGHGISREFLPFVFDRFRQADSAITRTHGGLGLGLAIVRSLVDVHGGTVSASSAGAGRGSTFTVKLPLPAPRRSSKPPKSEPPPLGSQSLVGLRVLIVDDEPDSLEVLAAVLSLQGADVITATSVRQALAALSHSRPDVIVSDIAMPGEDGYDLIRQLRALDPARGGRTVAVALTAHARAEDRARALAAGYHVHVSKPVIPAKLVAIIASLSAGAKQARPSGGSE